MPCRGGSHTPSLFPGTSDSCCSCNPGEARGPCSDTPQVYRAPYDDLQGLGRHFENVAKHSCYQSRREHGQADIDRNGDGEVIYAFNPFQEFHGVETRSGLGRSCPQKIPRRALGGSGATGQRLSMGGYAPLTDGGPIVPQPMLCGRLRK